jgi:hypothetical protein
MVDFFADRKDSLLAAFSLNFFSFKHEAVILSLKLF